MECALHGDASERRLIHILIQEIICDLDDATNEAVLLIRWTGGRHTRGARGARQDRKISCRARTIGRRGIAQTGRTLVRRSGTRRSPSTGCFAKDR